MIRVVDELEPLANVLRSAGYDVAKVTLDRVGSVLVAETNYALVLCRTCNWDSLESEIAEAQAQLTHLAARHPSPRSWDLYLIAVIASSANRDQEILSERIEHDTRYARKFVFAGTLTLDTARRALRPLLPLRATASLQLLDPLTAVRDELLAADIDAALIDTTLDAYRKTGKVSIP